MTSLKTSYEDNDTRKFILFRNEIQNYDSFNEKIRNMYQAELDEIFQDILIISKEDFISFISNGVKLLLSDMYSEDIFKDKTLIEIRKNCEKEINKEYNLHYEKLNKAYKLFEKDNKKNNIKSNNFLSHFRKHCSKTDNFAYHNCNNSQSKFYIIEENNIKKYVICINCQKVYLTNMILCHCLNCNIDYYSSILKKEEDENFLLGTWEKYHCDRIVNEKIKCLKCDDYLYLNLKTNILICLNPKCNFSSSPEKIIWSCNVCGIEFKSNIIVYNPLQNEYIKRIIKQTLFIKHKAHPNKLPCCNLNIFFTDFYHKKDCKGILYIGELNHKIIIVCEKCKAFNFYDRFIWTCPKCGIRFRDKKVLKSESEFKKKSDNNFKSVKPKSLFDVLMERKRNMKEEIERIRNEEENENKENNINNNNNNIEDNNSDLDNDEEDIKNNKENRNEIFNQLNNKKENKKKLLPIKEENESFKKSKNLNNTNSSSERENKSKENSNNKNNNNNNNNDIISLSKDPIQEEKIKKEINIILSKSKIPKFNIEEFTLHGQLGEGSYGIIYRAINNKTKKEYALKKIIAKNLDEIQSFENEFKLVYECNHKNIMKIYGITICNLDAITFALYVLMEIALFDWDEEIKKHVNERKYYKEEELIIILKQLISALLFMQKNLKVAHRDIKPQNILIFPNNIYKIADFGEAKEIKISKQLNTLRGTELYMSPLLYNGLKKDKDDVTHNPYKSDVFSLGFCFMYAAALNFNIIYEVRDLSDMNKIANILIKYLNNKYSHKFIQVLVLMMETDENKRVDFISLNKYVKKNFPDEDYVNNDNDKNNFNDDNIENNDPGVKENFDFKRKAFKNNYKLK